MELRILTFLVLMAVVPALADWQSDRTACGRQYNGLSVMIVGGEKAEKNEWPWQAALYRGGRRICGASVISTEWIITAAHCVDVIFEPEIFEFRVGSNNLKNDTGCTQKLQAIETYVHPGFDPSTLDNDIALFRVDGEFETWCNEVNTVCLPTANMADEFEVGEDAVVTGWGALEEGGGSPDELYEVTVPIYNQTLCNDAYDGEITENMICAGRPEGGVDSCQGDSGGPMVAFGDENTEQYYLIGIVSWGTGCARPNYPGVYTRVTQYEDWISPIFDGDSNTNPPAKNGTCAADEFLCRGGECIPDHDRCSGSWQCYHGTDEEFCEGLLTMFDVYYLIEIDPNDISGLPLENQPSKEECASYCLENGYQAFDATPEDGGTFTCEFAKAGYGTIEVANPNRTFNHFEIITQEPGDEFRQAVGVVASPSYFPGSSTSESKYTWTVNITSSNKDSLRFTFESVSGSSNCEDIDSDFALVTVTEVRDGDALSKTSYCLHPDVEGMEFSVHSKEAIVELLTTNASTHGFLLQYESYFDCERTYTIAPGAVTSPNYPDEYPNSVECNTHLQAPEDQVVYLRFDFMDIEPHSTCRYDSVSLYNGTSADAPLVASLCGTKVTSTVYQSVGRDMFVVFSSDGSVTGKGFKASFEFAKASVPTEDPDIAVINALESELASFKYGMAAACILGILLITVIAASLYTVTKRDESNADRVAKLEEAIQNFRNKTAAYNKVEEDHIGNDYETVGEVDERMAAQTKGSQGVQATKAAIVAETGYETTYENAHIKDKKAADIDDGVVNDGFVGDEGTDGAAAAVTAVAASVEEEDESESKNTTVVVADVSPPPEQVNDTSLDDESADPMYQESRDQPHTTEAVDTTPSEN